MNFFERLRTETRTSRHQLLSIPIRQDALHGQVPLPQYVAFLTQAYHHVKHTVPLLMACGSRLPERLGWLRMALVDYVAEEAGHEEWILADLAACGVDAEHVRHGTPAFETTLMLAYAYHQIDRCNPVGFLGMVHVLEGTSEAIATSAASAMRTALGLPAAAFTYLTSHGKLDIEHVKRFATLMDELDDPADQESVVTCAHAVYRLYGDIFRSLRGDGAATQLSEAA